MERWGIKRNATGQWLVLVSRKTYASISLVGHQVEFAADYRNATAFSPSDAALVVHLLEDEVDPYYESRSVPAFSAIRIS